LRCMRLQSTFRRLNHRLYGVCGSAVPVRWRSARAAARDPPAPSAVGPEVTHNSDAWLRESSYRRTDQRLTTFVTTCRENPGLSPSSPRQHVSLRRKRHPPCSGWRTHLSEVTCADISNADPSRPHVIFRRGSAPNAVSDAMLVAHTRDPQEPAIPHGRLRRLICDTSPRIRMGRSPQSQQVASEPSELSAP